MPALIGVKWADANEAVNTAFALQITVGIIPYDAQGGAADAGLLVAQLVDQLGLIAVALGPAGIEAQEHLRPVAGLGAASAGLNLEKSVAGVLRAAEHGLQFEIVQPMLHAPQFLVELGIQTGIFHGQLAQRLEVPARALQLFEGLQHRGQFFQLLNGFLGFVRIVPEGRLAHEIVQLGALPLLAGDVKDCPAAG